MSSPPGRNVAWKGFSMYSKGRFWVRPVVVPLKRLFEPAPEMRRGFRHGKMGGIVDQNL